MPEPFSPITPNVLPAGTLNDTPPSAVKVSPGERSDEQAAGDERALERAELVPVLEAPVDLGHIAGLDGEGRAHTSSASVSRSRSNSQAPNAQGEDGDHRRRAQAAPVVESPLEERLLVGDDHVRHRVEAEHGLHARAQVAVRVEHRRREEPHVQEMAQDALDVAEVHGERGHDECQPQHEHELDQDGQHHQHRRWREPAVVQRGTAPVPAGPGASAPGWCTRSRPGAPPPGTGPS